MVIHEMSEMSGMSGTAKLSRDMAMLINNRQGSDIQFKVGGGITSILQENGKTLHNESATVTLYAHSIILRCRSRYFSTMLDEEKNWKESSKGIIYKPNISPSTLQDVLHYIYTGNVRAKASENIMELIAAADEMDLEELSVGCQNELIRTVKYIFSSGDDSGDEGESISETLEGSTKQRISIDVALRTLIIPALNLASSHSLSYLSQKLLTMMLPNMSAIVKSPITYTTFVNNISSEALTEIIASDNLAMAERSVWNLTLSWACHQMNLSKATVEARLASIKDDDEGDSEESSDEELVSDVHLGQLKKTLAPLLPAIRFSLLDYDDYALMANTLNYLLPRYRYYELNQYFVNTNHVGQLDTPRTANVEQKGLSRIVVKYATWEFLRKKIFETGGITGCSSFKDLKFELLFRASEHGFLASTFHKRCDNKGPTLTLVRSADGHFFGGVNFAHWKSDSTYSSSPLNFLFALPDGHHRKNTLIFKNIDARYSSYNHIDRGPTFSTAADLLIANSADSNNYSYSRLPRYYSGSEASKTALAGAEYFAVSDYEVFAISKK